MSNLFKIQTRWLSEDKPFTYADYAREFSIQSTGKPELIGSAAPSYKGLVDHYNPEDLLVAAISGCHMLSYLALAANAKITVLSYEDEAVGQLIKHGMSMKFSEVTLNPVITIAASDDVAKAEALHEKAHAICFIGNSVNFTIHVKPVIKN